MEVSLCAIRKENHKWAAVHIHKNKRSFILLNKEHISNNKYIGDWVYLTLTARNYR
jgi:hypothetical protein